MKIILKNGEKIEKEKGMAGAGTMTDERKAVLEAGGFNVDEAMKRFMNSEQLWIKFLKKFKADASFEDLKKAIEEKDREKAFAAAHTLKGITGNLAMSRFNTLISEQTEHLRGEESGFETAAAMMPQVKEMYEESVRLINEVYGE